MEPIVSRKVRATSNWVLGPLALSLALAGGQALGQPTGNPKGTVAPSVKGTAPKPPATRADTTTTPSTPAPSDQGAMGSETRAGQSSDRRTPGSGTAGGLTGRHPGGQGSSTGTTETNQTRPVK